MTRINWLFFFNQKHSTSLIHKFDTYKLIICSESKTYSINCVVRLVYISLTKPSQYYIVQINIHKYKKRICLSGHTILASKSSPYTDWLHHCLLSTSKLVCGGRSGAIWLLSHHPGGCCTLVVDEEISPLLCKALWTPRKTLYKCNKLLLLLLLLSIHPSIHLVVVYLLAFQSDSLSVSAVIKEAEALQTLSNCFVTTQNLWVSHEVKMPESTSACISQMTTSWLWNSSSWPEPLAQE